MENCSLTLIPYGKSQISIPLFLGDIKQSQIERIIEHTDNGGNVFSDLSYEFILGGIDIEQVKNVFVYVNQCFELCNYKDGHIHFPAKGNGERRIFSDCYGFVEINLTVQMIDDSELNLRSGYLPVLVKKGTLNDSVRAMANYVYEHQEDLLLNGEPKPTDLAGLKEHGYRSLMAQIILAEEIVAIYEKSYGYFKANSRFKIENIAAVDDADKLKYVTPTTMQYIALHPEQLKRVNSTSGIRINNAVYHPKKTLVVRDVCSYDTYENRIIVGFLHSMIIFVQKLIDKSLDLLKKVPNEKEHVGDYIYSSVFIFSQTAKMLDDGIMRLNFVKKKLELLWRMYSNIMNVTPQEVYSVPKLTEIFLSVPQYNKIFIRIDQWFKYGIYDFAKETFMLSFIKISNLYESYLLSKLIMFFKSREFNVETKRCYYPISQRWKYKNTECNNTFIFQRESRQITLYYQPVIFDMDSSHVNDIGLYRNNTISLNHDNDDERRGRYYVPDFVLKFKTGQREKYIIIDAKFSSLKTVRTNYIVDLVYKYIFSISPIAAHISVEGLCIIYGQCCESEVLQSIYDKQIANNMISPFAETLPLMEGINGDNHEMMIEQLLNKVGIL